MRAINVETMRDLEAQTMSLGVSGYTLMERAGLAAAEIIAHEAERRKCRHIAIFCGSGNNGGDGFVVAKSLKNFDIELFLARPIAELKGDAAQHAQELPNNIITHSLEESPQFSKKTLIVDALLGTGFTGELRPNIATAIEKINSSQSSVVAIDIPSGLNGDSGESSLAVEADVTITFGLPKVGLFGRDGAKHCGIIYLDTIGIPENLLAQAPSKLEVTLEQDVDNLLPKLAYNDYKNSRGRVVVVGGSSAYSGAPLLAAKGAMRSGAGFVRLITNTIPYAPIPAALVLHQDEELSQVLTQVDAVVAGMGWGVSARSYQLLKEILKSNTPTILDADALNLLSQHQELKITNSATILTPHVGEAQRLFKAQGVAMPQERIAAAQLLAKLYNCVVVWKGPQTVVATSTGEYAINSNGTPALGICGSGDVLSGMIGAFAAMGLDAFSAARVGVFEHGKRGDVIPRRGLIADDLTEKTTS